MPATLAQASPAPLFTPPKVFPGYGQLGDFGANWRVQFADADGLPLNMVSFEVIDFGAISWTEIFQNVKVILSTPVYSAMLERLLGVDQTIVDLPIDRAAEATVAILDALYYWEPRAQATDIQFSSDVISGHLVVNLKLNIRNVIYGTDQLYDRANVFGTPDRVTQELPPMQQPVLIPGPPGAAGARGSLWFTGATDPASTMTGLQANDMYLNTTTGDVFQFRAVSGTRGVIYRWERIQAPWAGT